MIIILIRGFSNSGKDFIGEIICKQYGYKQFSFANSLKKIVSNMYNIPLDLLYSQEGKHMICINDINKRNHRQLLIDEALNLKKDNFNIFVEHCCNEIKQKQSINNNDKIVITDWRFINEYDVLKNTFPDARIIPTHVIRINQHKSPIDDISEYHLIDRENDKVIINNMDNTIYDNIYYHMNSIVSNTI
jgi:hypothetical protein